MIISVDVMLSHDTCENHAESFSGVVHGSEDDACSLSTVSP